MTGGFRSFKYFSADMTWQIIDLASRSGITLFCFKKKSKSLPSQYSCTVQNLREEKIEIRGKIDRQSTYKVGQARRKRQKKRVQQKKTHHVNNLTKGECA